MPRRLDSLTGLRALAAIVVFFHHSAAIPALRHVTAQGRVGVSFFFILSGFVLMWVRDDRVAAATFYRRRIARIVPTYLVCLLAIFALAATLHITTDSVKPLGLSALLLQAWVPHPYWYYGLSPVAWSLSVEAFFYLTFPWWAPRLAAVSDTGLRRVAIGCLVAIVALAALAQIEYSGGGLAGTPDSMWVWLVRTAPPARIAEFLIGACAATYVRRGGTRFDVGLGWALALSLLGYALAGAVTSMFSPVAFTVVPFTLVIVAAARADIRREPTVFSRPVVVWAGVISYAFYLVHYTVIELFDTYAAVPGRILLELPVAVAVAAVLHYVVEAPAERYLRGGRNSVVVSSSAVATQR